MRVLIIPHVMCTKCYANYFWVMNKEEKRVEFRHDFDMKAKKCEDAEKEFNVSLSEFYRDLH